MNCVFKYIFSEVPSLESPSIKPTCLLNTSNLLLEYYYYYIAYFTKYCTNCWILYLKLKQIILFYGELTKKKIFKCNNIYSKRFYPY